jgi:hypothetical protein
MRLSKYSIFTRKHSSFLPTPPVLHNLRIMLVFYSSLKGLSHDIELTFVVKDELFTKVLIRTLEVKAFGEIIFIGDFFKITVNKSSPILI